MPAKPFKRAKRAIYIYIYVYIYIICRIWQCRCIEPCFQNSQKLNSWSRNIFIYSSMKCCDYFLACVLILIFKCVHLMAHPLPWNLTCSLERILTRRPRLLLFAQTIWSLKVTETLRTSYDFTQLRAVILWKCLHEDPANRTTVREIASLQHKACVNIARSMPFRLPL